MRNILAFEDLRRPRPIVPIHEVARTPQTICELAARLAAVAFGVSADQVIFARRSTRRVSSARHTGIYLAHTAAGLPLSKVAEFFARDRTTAAYACRLIEERRDDLRFDAALSELEELLRAICGFER